MTKRYQKAIAANDAAIAKYDDLRKRYRARLIGDTEFIAGREEYRAAVDRFDKAFAREFMADLEETVR